MASVIDRQQPLRHQLAEHAAPRGLRQGVADAESGQRLVMPLLDALGGVAA